MQTITKRDIVKNPFTADELIHAVARAALNATPHQIVYPPPPEDDGLALLYTRKFLEQEGVQPQLRRFLETIQPKPEHPALGKLDKKELQSLMKDAHPGHQTNPKIWDFEFRGVSSRGSYVYDVNNRMASYVRVYVRREPDGSSRAEFYEDNFELPKRGSKVEPVSAQKTEPVSATLKWWQRVVEKWRSL